MFVVGLVGQGVRDLLQIDAVQIQHLARIGLYLRPHSKNWDASNGR
jgi:hypothetical protein